MHCLPQGEDGLQRLHAGTRGASAPLCPGHHFRRPQRRLWTHGRVATKGSGDSGQGGRVPGRPRPTIPSIDVVTRFLPGAGLPGAQHHARHKGRTPGRPSPTPRPGVAWGSHCRALCPSGSQAAVLWSGSPWRPLLPGQTTSLATSTSGIAKKNKRSLRLAFFHSLVRRLVSRHKACQLGGRVSSCG